MRGIPSELRQEHVDALDRDLIDTLPGGFVHVRADGSVSSANAEALRILGLRLDTLTQRYTVDFETETIAEDGSPFAAADYPVSRALATGSAQGSATIGVRRPDGKVIWAVFRATPIKDAQSEAVLGAIVSFVDITERKLAEDTVRDQREQLRKAQELAKMGSWEWDMLTSRVQWSDEMRRLHDDPHFDGTVERGLLHVHPDDTAVMQAHMAHALREGSHANLHYRVVRSDGTVTTIWSLAEIGRDASGRPIKMIGTAQDVTEQRKVEEALRAAQRLDTVGRLAGGVAHDFNNLLQIIVANVDAGLKYGRPLDALRDIGVAATRASELTRQLLALGRRTPFTAVAFAPGDTLGELAQLLPRMLGPRITLDLALPPDLAVVQGDPGQLLQVLINLSINARDAMPQGGRLAISACNVETDRKFRQLRPWSVAPRYVQLTVSDTGIGMAPAVLAHVFEPFFTTKAAEGGTGLGLAIAYGIIEQHGGQIEVQSAPGAGTTFRIYLPAQPSPSVERPVAIRDRGDSAATAPRFNEEHVLVVEDESRVRAVIVSLLQRAGLTVLEASDGFGALELLDARTHDIKLVLSDIQMPRMDGYELTTQLLERHPGLPIVLLTGAAPLLQLQDAVQAVRALQKPVDVELLLRTIRELL